MRRETRSETKYNALPKAGNRKIRVRTSYEQNRVEEKGTERRRGSMKRSTRRKRTGRKYRTIAYSIINCRKQVKVERK